MTKNVLVVVGLVSCPRSTDLRAGDPDAAVAAYAAFPLGPAGADAAAGRPRWFERGRPKSPRGSAASWPSCPSHEDQSECFGLRRPRRSCSDLALRSAGGCSMSVRFRGTRPNAR